MNYKLDFIRYSKGTAYGEDSPSIAICLNGMIVGYLTHKQVEEIKNGEDHNKIPDRITFPPNDLTMISK